MGCIFFELLLVSYEESGISILLVSRYLRGLIDIYVELNYR